MSFTFKAKNIGIISRDVKRRVLPAAATSYAAQLDENVTRGSRSGIQHLGLPFQSSSPDEYPQEQFGDLRESVDNRLESNQWLAGFFGDKTSSNDDDFQEKLDSLEFGTINIAPRNPLQRTAFEKTWQSEAIRLMGKKIQ